MNDFLQNPVYYALLSGDKHLSFGSDEVRYFEEQVSAFVGFDKNNVNGFEQLHELLSKGRRILFATTTAIVKPDRWQLQHEIKGVQFVYNRKIRVTENFNNIFPLEEKHIDQMLHLASVTKPGPFGRRTIDFGSYYGIFDGEKLVAMTGQRLHVQNYTEISAVCTLPGYTGKGYAYQLLLHQLQLILQQGQHPFLHVREDNHRAIELYKRIGFEVSGPMIFYFMKRE